MNKLSRLLLSVARRIPRGYWRLISWAAKRDAALHDFPLTLRRFPHTVLRADLRESVYIPIFRTGTLPHQEGLDTLCVRLLQSGDMVIDVGANVGYMTLVFSNLVGPSGCVLSIEPSPRSYELLVRSVQAVENVFCLNAAAGSNSGELDFYVTDQLDRASATRTAAARHMRVPCSQLDNLVEGFRRPTLVKVDVEGMEPDVFRGMARIFQESRLPILLFESLTEEALVHNTTQLDTLSAGRYTIFRVGADGSLLDADTKVGTNDFVALPADQIEQVWRKLHE